MNSIKVFSTLCGAVIIALLSLSCIADFSSAPYVDDRPCPEGLWDVPVEFGKNYIRDYEYQIGRIFDLGPDTSFATGDSIKKLIIYVMDMSGVEDNVKDCRIYIDPYDTSYESGLMEALKMHPLDPTTYSFYSEAERNRHYLFFEIVRYTGTALGMYMEVLRGDGSIDTVGSLSGDTLTLKTLRQSFYLDNTSSETWSYMWRNTYKIPSGFAVEDLNIVIKKGLTETESDPHNVDEQWEWEDGIVQATHKYIEILGLDQYDQTGDRRSDNIVDDHSAVYRPDLGLLIFPHRTPFDTDTTYGTQSNPLPPISEYARVPNIYNYNTPAEKLRGSTYYIEYGQGYRSTIVEFPCNNISNYCFSVYFNSIKLIAGADYAIGFSMGDERNLLYIYNQAALDPRATLQIDFGNCNE